MLGLEGVPDRETTWLPGTVLVQKLTEVKVSSLNR